jgi:transposase
VAKGRKVNQEVRTFRTTTEELLALADWLEASKCTHVAMEATGVYWKPVWHILEGHFELLLANAMHIRNIPGRKSDVNDAMWISDLLAHGLIRGSFVPPESIQELRALTRTRKQLVREVAQHCNRIQKVLEDANVKLGSVVSDVLGATGRAILEALIDGETDPAELAKLAQGSLKKKREALQASLLGCVTKHHVFMLKLHYDQVLGAEEAIREIERELGESLVPYQHQADLLATIPGISDTVARTLIAEIGPDMSRFPTAGHLISWAGLCPGMNESAGKRKSTRLRKGAPWLKTALVTAAWAAMRKNDSYLRAQFYRIKGRRGPKKAIIAVAASMLTAAYHMLSNGTPYQDLGASHFDQRDQTKVAKRLVTRLQDLGYQVAITKESA